MRIERIIAVTALLLAGICAQAQIRLGVKAGYAASWIPGTVLIGDAQVLPHSFFYGGATIDWDSGNMLYLQGEIIYAGKGYTDRTWLPDGSSEKYKLNLSYIQIPLLVGIKFADDRCFVAAGPEPGFLVGANSTFKGETYSAKEYCNTFNLGIALQTGYMITDDLGVELKFDWGTTRTFNGKLQEMAQRSFKENGHNLSLQLGLCYKFDI